MNPMLGFAPYILFAVLMQVSIDLALWTALAAAFGLSTYTFLHSRSLRILDAGGVALFGALAFYTGFVQPSLSIAHIHLAANAGMLAIALASLALRNAFALPHEQKVNTGQAANSSLCAKPVVMVVWTASFGLMTALDIVASIYRKLPLSLNVAMDLAILVFAVIFTAQYPSRDRKKNINVNRVEKRRAID